MTALATLIRETRQQHDLSLRQVAARSKGGVSTSRLSSIEHGDIPTDDRILAGIAKGLGVPVAQVREAAGRSRAAPLPPFRLPRAADRLNARERKVVLAVVAALLDAHKPR